MKFVALFALILSCCGWCFSLAVQIPSPLRGFLLEHNIGMLLYVLLPFLLMLPLVVALPSRSSFDDEFRFPRQRMRFVPQWLRVLVVLHLAGALLFLFKILLFDLPAGKALSGEAALSPISAFMALLYLLALASGLECRGRMLEVEESEAPRDLRKALFQQTLDR